MNLSYNDKPVFKELNWIFKRGEHWRIAGPNGSGKSSLLGMISGDNPKAYGKDITLFGVKRGSGESIWDIKRYFGIVSNALHRDHRAPGNTLDVVLSGFYDSIGLHDKATPSQIKIGVEWLSLLGMEGHRKTSFTQLSFGEQRSVLIARAMVKLPMILLLDEPLTGLDENHRNQVLALIDYIADNSQTHILFVSHDQRNDLSCINKNLEFFKSGDHYKIRINS